MPRIKPRNIQEIFNGYKKLDKKNEKKMKTIEIIKVLKNRKSLDLKKKYIERNKNIIEKKTPNFLFEGKLISENFMNVHQIIINL